MQSQILNSNQPLGTEINSELVVEPCESGSQMEKYKRLDVLVENDCTTEDLLKNCSGERLQKRKKRKATSTLESAVRNKVKTSKDRLKSSKKHTLNTLSLKTSDPVLISRGKDCVPYWTEYTKELSEKLWYCTKTDFLDLPHGSWNTSLKNLALGSWFTVRAKTSQIFATSPMISSQSLPSLSQAIMEKEAQNIKEFEDNKKNKEKKKKENKEKAARVKKEIKEKEMMKMDIVTSTEKEKELVSSANVKKEVKKKKLKTELNESKKEEVEIKTLRARKIRIYPTEEQAIVLKNWYGSCRFIYNQAVAKTKLPGVSFKELKIEGLRHDFLSEEFKMKNAWLKDTPFDILDNSLRDLVKARIAHFSKLKLAKRADPAATIACSFKFRSKKDKQQTLVIRGRDWNRKSGHYSNIFSKNKILASEELPTTIESEFRVILDRLGHYYLCIPRQVKKASENQAPRSHHGVVSLDPGVRTFQTCYDADGLVTEWGDGDMKLLFQDCYAADRLQGIINETKGKKNKTKRRRRKIAWLRKLQRIQHKIGEVHKKLSTWLCRNYRIILIPKFDVQNMIQHKGRKIRSNTARGMCQWSHFRFRQMLMSKSELHPWCKVIVCDEAYTSKTCGNCGTLNQKLGSSKTFSCDNCLYKADRDISASRNILLRYLTRNQSASPVVVVPMPLGACSL